MPKTSQHFIVLKTKETHSRTEGGSNYTLAVYEITGKGKPLELIASCEACTRGHKGEDNEALAAIIRSGTVRPAILKRCGVNEYRPRSAYYTQAMREAGLIIDYLA